MKTYYRIQPIGKDLPTNSRDIDGNILDGIFVFKDRDEIRETLPYWGYAVPGREQDVVGTPQTLEGEEVVVIRYDGQEWLHPLENGTLIDPARAEIIDRMPIAQAIQESPKLSISNLLLSEAAKTPADLPRQTYVTVERTSDGILVYFSDLMGQLSDEPLSGIIEAYEPDNLTGPCDGALVVRRAFVTGGFGPMLYDLAMEAAGDRGLTMDRETLTGEAFRVWEYYKDRRPDVDAIRLTDCTKGPKLDVYQMEYEEGESPIDFRYVKSEKTVTDALRSTGKLIEM